MKFSLCNAEQAFASLPIIQPLNSNIEIDFGLLSNPVFTSQYLGTAHKGEFYYTPRPTESPGSPVAMPDSLDLTKMVQIFGSQYSGNSILYALQQSGRIEAHVFASMIPPDAPVHLNTSDVAWMLLAPGLASKFPNMPMQLYIYTTESPVTGIEPLGGNVNATGNMDVQVVFENGTVVTAFTLNGTVYCSANATMRAENISVDLTYLFAEFGLLYSNIGQVYVTQFDKLIDLLAQHIIPLVNQKIGAGIPIPAVDGITFTNPEINWNQGFIMIATDVVYNPTKIFKK